MDVKTITAPIDTPIKRVTYLLLRLLAGTDDKLKLYPAARTDGKAALAFIFPDTTTALLKAEAEEFAEVVDWLPLGAIRFQSLAADIREMCGPMQDSSVQ